MKKILLTTIIITFTLFTQAQDTIKNIVFEGAGIRGLAYSGAIAALNEHHKLDYLENIGGTSAGAITASAMCLDYTPQEIEDIIHLTKFNKFNQSPLFGFFRLKKKFGFYKTKKFDQWLGDIIEKKTGNPDITFSDLQKLGYKNLYCVATLLDEQRTEVYSVKTHPNMKIRDAVRASMTIPFYFETMFIDDNGQVYKSQKENPKAHVVCDGGILGNYPIQIFDSIVEGYRIPNKHTIGIRIDEDEQIELDRTTSNKDLANIDIKKLKNYTEAFYKITHETVNRAFLNEYDWKRTISVSSGNIGPKIKKMSTEEKELLINNGKKGVQEYYSK